MITEKRITHTHCSITLSHSKAPENNLFTVILIGPGLNVSHQ